MILQKIQEQLKAPKNQFNSFGKYKYRSCEDILEGLKPLLKEHKAVILISDEMVNIGERYYVKAMATLKAGEEEHTVSAYAREAQTKKGMDEAQITGSASSYARKYALNGLLAIDDTKDDDSKRPTPPNKKNEIKALLDGITPGLNSKEDYQSLCQQITSLPLEDKNFDEIINRLKAHNQQ